MNALALRSGLRTSERISGRPRPEDRRYDALAIHGELDVPEKGVASFSRRPPQAGQ